MCTISKVIFSLCLQAASVFNCRQHSGQMWPLTFFKLLTTLWLPRNDPPLRHGDIVSRTASELPDRIKLIKRSLWILWAGAASSSQTGSPLTFNLMRNIFTVTFWKRVSDPIQHSGVRRWAIYLPVLPMWTQTARGVHATCPKPHFHDILLFSPLLNFTHWKKNKGNLNGMNLCGGQIFSLYGLISSCFTPQGHSSPSCTFISHMISLTDWPASDVDNVGWV